MWLRREKLRGDGVVSLGKSFRGFFSLPWIPSSDSCSIASHIHLILISVAGRTFGGQNDPLWRNYPSQEDIRGFAPYLFASRASSAFSSTFSQERIFRVWQIVPILGSIGIRKRVKKAHPNKITIHTLSTKCIMTISQYVFVERHPSLSASLCPR